MMIRFGLLSRSTAYALPPREGLSRKQALTFEHPVKPHSRPAVLQGDLLRISPVKESFLATFIDGVTTGIPEETSVQMIRNVDKSETVVDGTLHLSGTLGSTKNTIPFTLTLPSRIITEKEGAFRKLEKDERIRIQDALILRDRINQMPESEFEQIHSARKFK